MAPVAKPYAGKKFDNSFYNLVIIWFHNCFVLCKILIKTWNGKLSLFILGHILLKLCNGHPSCPLPKKIINYVILTADFSLFRLEYDIFSLNITKYNDECMFLMTEL